MPKCSLRQLLSRATSRRNGPACKCTTPVLHWKWHMAGRWISPSMGLWQHHNAGFLSLLYAYLFPYFLSLHYIIFLPLPLYSLVKTPPEVFHSTTRSLQRKLAPFYCKMSRLESLPSAVSARREDAKQREEAKTHPQQGK